MTHAHDLSHAINTYEVWLKELEDKPAIHSPDEAWAGMRAVLQTLRDRLPPAECVHLSAQLPLIARGVFFEGWKPDGKSQKMDQQEFYDRVKERLGNQNMQADPSLLTEYVFEIINHHVDPGQVRHVKAILPTELENLWPEQKAA